MVHGTQAPRTRGTRGNGSGHQRHGTKCQDADSASFRFPAPADLTIASWAKKKHGPRFTNRGDEDLSFDRERIVVEHLPNGAIPGAND